MVEMKGKAVSGQAGRSSFADIDHRRTSSITRRCCVGARSGSWGRVHGGRELLGGLRKTCIRAAGGLWRCGGRAGGLGRGCFGVKSREFSLSATSGAHISLREAPGAVCSYFLGPLPSLSGLIAISRLSARARRREGRHLPCRLPACIWTLRHSPLGRCKPQSRVVGTTFRRNIILLPQSPIALCVYGSVTIATFLPHPAPAAHPTPAFVQYARRLV